MSFFSIEDSLLSGDDTGSSDDTVLTFLKSISPAANLSLILERGLSFLLLSGLSALFLLLLSLLGDGEARIGESRSCPFLGERN